jgi:hypothetical protein
MVGSLLAFQMARLATLEYVVHILMREHLRRAGQSASDVKAYSEPAKKHFETHPPLGIPAAAMTAAVDLFLNTLAAGVNTDAANSDHQT